MRHHYTGITPEQEPLVGHEISGLSSGCDVVLVCNDRLATNEVIRTLESQAWVNPQADRLSRLAGGAIDQTVDVDEFRMRLSGLAN